MFLKKFGDLAAGVFFLILSIALFLAASALPPSLMGGLGSDFMPRFWPSLPASSPSFKSVPDSAPCEAPAE